MTNTEQLKSSQQENGPAALRAFLKLKQVKPARRINYDWTFEHDQLWVVNTTTGAIWSVVDAEGGSSLNGYGFEVVSWGEEE